MSLNINSESLIKSDPFLEPYSSVITMREGKLQDTLKQLENNFGSLKETAEAYRYFGFNPGKNRKGKLGIWYREWAPGALSLFLTGDFNQWSRFSHPMKKDDNGVWSIFISQNELVPGSRVKVHVVSKSGNQDRIPAYIRHVIPESGSNHLVGAYNPSTKYNWRHKSPKLISPLRVYEAHIGIAQAKLGIGSFDEFRTNTLPRIKKLGYNAIQLMAIAEHPYYASFGYQVSNFFAVSHRFGSDKSLKQLIDDAHEMGIVVLMDLVHAHAIKNVYEGLNQFDGTNHQYFHSGSKGDHPAWDTKLFDYAKPEVLRFLLSNVAYWMQEFRFDGFRFDGVTSMIYSHHGLGTEFNHYDRYFSHQEVDEDALAYLKLANLLVKQINPKGITVAEDVSGMPGMALSVKEGGVGFDYRLSMGIPDYWIKILKHRKDEDWSMSEIFDVMTNRRLNEKHVAYAESHDQALVGDKTIAFWLMDKYMYWHMNKEDEHPVIDRGIALHKLIRLITLFLGGEAYLNFMGNEFGHPEWIDFPRAGNNNSFHFARRQWDLLDNPELKYQDLNNFDRALMKLDEEHKILSQGQPQLLFVQEDRKLIVARRGDFILAVNLHPTDSYPDLIIDSSDVGAYKLILDSDKKKFGGHGRITRKKYPDPLTIYLPNRTGLVFNLDSG